MNLAVSEIRKHRPSESLDELDEEVQDETDIEQAYISAESAESVKRALNHLSEEHRSVVILRHYQDLSYQEIAEVLNCSEGTVKSRLHYALKHLSKILSSSASGIRSCGLNEMRRR